MSVRDDFKNYMSKYGKDKILNILFKNSMMNIIGDEYIKLDDIGFNVNRVWANYNWRRANEIFKVFEKKGIEYIVFKGNVISQLLYGDPYKRDMGDVDFFVFENNYNSAQEILRDFGFWVMKNGGEKNPHHITYTDGKLIVELHKSILTPIIGIDETYLRHHIIKRIIADNEVVTFDITATLAHLIYHLYMDTWLTDASMYYFLRKRKFPQTKRFFYRAYEIALFAEKYSDVINWREILNDISTQNLRICFKKMIMDILDIFPNFIPTCFVEEIFKLNYVDEERDQLYKYLIESNCGENIDDLLCAYIDQKWEARKEKNISISLGDTIVLAKKAVDEGGEELICEIKTEMDRENLKMVFKVSSDDFCISDSNNFDTQSSDGIHLLLCSTDGYSYNSFFIFPKEHNGSYNAITCNVLNKPYTVLGDTVARTEFEKNDRFYIITVVLSKNFLIESHMEEYFYLGTVVSDCSNETLRRKNQLVLSEDESQWYNPAYFAKIYMNKNLTAGKDG